MSSIFDFEKSVLNNKIDKIVNTISIGNVISVNDRLYFNCNSYMLSNIKLIKEEISYKLLELLLLNNKWKLARLLSTKNFFYKFDNIYDNRFPKNALLYYLLGDYNFSPFPNGKQIYVDYHTESIFNNLEEKSKNYVESLLMKNYKYLYDAYLYGKAHGGIEKCRYGFDYISRNEKNELVPKCFFIDDNIYKNFNVKDKQEVVELLEKMK